MKFIISVWLLSTTVTLLVYTTSNAQQSINLNLENQCLKLTTTTPIKSYKQSVLPICMKALHDIQTTEMQKTHITKAILSYFYFYGTSKRQYQAAVNFCFNQRSYIAKIKRPIQPKLAPKFSLPSNVCNTWTFYLGTLYFQVQNYVLAYKWLSSSDATKDDSGISQFSLGYMYLYSLGTQQNLDKAIYWFNLAVDHAHNDISAIWGNLARAYAMKQNYRTAFDYYTAAAKLGDAYSQMRLAWLYQQGKGTIQDNIQAYAWASTAVANGFKKDEYGNIYKTNENNAIALRNSIALSLSLADKSGKGLAKARELAKKYYQLYVLHQKYKPTLKDLSKRKLSIIARIKKAWDDLK